MSTADIDSKMAEQDSGNVRALPFGGLFLFTLLSVADLSLTWFLLTEGGGRFIESNPIAAAWLSSYGWAGLVVYKILGLLLVATVVILISLRRPRTGKRLLTFAIVALTAVTLYSYYLLVNLF
jgi:hypothetical protein